MSPAKRSVFLYWPFCIFSSEVCDTGKFGLNPDFAVEIVMRGKKAIKTGIRADFLDEIIVNYGEIKKIKQMPVFEAFFSRNRFQLQNLG